MELKHAIAICLITLFSATLVVLIARSLDNQAASRLEPQLAQIVEELRALRSSGGFPAPVGDTDAVLTAEDGLTVYYFHGDIRCQTCRAIESQTEEVVERDFAEQLGRGEITWKKFNYDRPASAELVDKFDVHMANVVLAQMEEGQIQDWKRLDQVWALHGDKTKFADFMRTEIAQMLVPDEQAAQPQSASETPNLPVPDESGAVPAAESSSTDIPLPE